MKQCGYWLIFYTAILMCLGLVFFDNLPLASAFSAGLGGGVVLMVLQLIVQALWRRYGKS